MNPGVAAMDFLRAEGRSSACMSASSSLRRSFSSRADNELRRTVARSRSAMSSSSAFCSTSRSAFALAAASSAAICSGVLTASAALASSTMAAASELDEAPMAQYDSMEAVVKCPSSPASR